MRNDKGIKYDTGKDRFALLPWDAIREVAKVFTFGATKYADRNWEIGIAYDRVYSSTMRHLTDWWELRMTYDSDPKGKAAGMRNIAQAAWGCMVLLAFELRGRTDLDNRPTHKVPQEALDRLQQVLSDTKAQQKVVNVSGKVRGLTKAKKGGW